MEKIVPLTGRREGPLGVAHLPRLWLKCSRAAFGPEAIIPGTPGRTKPLSTGSGSMRCHVRISRDGTVVCAV